MLNTVIICKAARDRAHEFVETVQRKALEAIEQYLQLPFPPTSHGAILGDPANPLVLNIHSLSDALSSGYEKLMSLPRLTCSTRQVVTDVHPRSQGHPVDLGDPFSAALTRPSPILRYCRCLVRRLPHSRGVYPVLLLCRAPSHPGVLLTDSSQAHQQPDACPALNSTRPLQARQEPCAPLTPCPTLRYRRPPGSQPRRQQSLRRPSLFPSRQPFFSIPSSLSCAYSHLYRCISSPFHYRRQYPASLLFYLDLPPPFTAAVHKPPVPSHISTSSHHPLHLAASYPLRCFPTCRTFTQPSLSSVTPLRLRNVESRHRAAYCSSRGVFTLTLPPRG